MPTFTMAELDGSRDIELGESDWIVIDQQRIDTFADATDDHQWIHTDAERAAEGPFGGIIAHGYLTVALLAPLFSSLLEISDARMVVNYGIDRLRLTAPVPVDARVRATGRVKDATKRGDGLMIRAEVTVEIEDEPKPALKGTVVYVAYG